MNVDPVQIGLAAGLGALLLEGVKWVVRILKRDPEYSLPAKFYVIMLPVATFAAEPALAWLGEASYTVPADTAGWLKEGFLVFIKSMIAVLIDQQALGKFVDSMRARALGKG